MTNVDDLLQLGLIFFTSAVQLNRKKHLEKKNQKTQDSIRFCTGREPRYFFSQRWVGSIWTLLRLCVFTLKSNVIRIKSINYVAYLSVSEEQCAEPVHL